MGARHEKIEGLTHGFPHTPGPYCIVLDHTEFGGTDEAGDTVVYGVSAIFPVSEVGEDNIEVAHPVATMNENWGEFDSTARLFCAAPDMLAALEAVRRAYDGEPGALSDFEVMMMVRRAITLAKTGLYAEYGDELYPALLPEGYMPAMQEDDQ